MHVRKWFVCLLFFLFLFLMGCQRSSSNALQQSYENKEYGKTIIIAQTALKKTIQSESLLYEAKANAALGNTLDAYEELLLFLALYDSKDPYWHEANTLMCKIGLEEKQYQSVLASGQALEQSGLLEGETPQYYYQALVFLGRTEQASKVFSTYLKNNIGQYQYAKMLLEAKVKGPEFVQVFEGLGSEEQLSLLEFAASDTVTGAYATELLGFAIPLEKAFEDGPKRKRVYSVLERLYGFSDQRVLQRKYGTLADK
ncbi:hypothetical protein [uncultured Sphaerochaeta sp.]|uniref:hypothetical protein n=1 Tax=uncultured Sphaerochaeta sp. TaxID=886478 RepID=UPI002A0A5E18|nr:hypothetical protein [uncultured Sphaerochaeta sp.]